MQDGKRIRRTIEEIRQAKMLANSKVDNDHSGYKLDDYTACTEEKFNDTTLQASEVNLLQTRSLREYAYPSKLIPSHKNVEIN